VRGGGKGGIGGGGDLYQGVLETGGDYSARGRGTLLEGKKICGEMEERSSSKKAPFSDGRFVQGRPRGRRQLWDSRINVKGVSWKSGVGGR